MRALPLRNRSSQYSLATETATASDPRLHLKLQTTPRRKEITMQILIDLRTKLVPGKMPLWLVSLPPERNMRRSQVSCSLIDPHTITNDKVREKYFSQTNQRR